MILSWITIAASLILIVLSYLFNKLYLRSKLLAKFYKQQGLVDISDFEGSKVGRNLFSGDVIEDVHKKMINNREFKGIFTNIYDKFFVSLTSLESIKDLSKSQDIVKYENRVQKLFNPLSLVRMEGEKHKKMRKILSASFHFEFLASNINTIQQVVQEKFKEWEDKGLIGTEYIDILPEATNVAGEVIGALFFGMSYKNDIIRGRRLTDHVSQFILKGHIFSQKYLIYPWLYYLYLLQIVPNHREIAKDYEAYEDFLKNKIKKIKAEFSEKGFTDSEKNNNLLFRLLKVQLETQDDNNKLSDDEIRAQFMLFINAGQETTAHLITMCLYWLTQYPDYKDHIREEINQLEASGKSPTYPEINQLKMLNAIVRETLRLYSPAQELIPRVAKVDVVLGGIKVKKGTIINAYLTSNHFRNDVFADPLTFKPERWIDNGEGNNLKDPFIYIPFWAGYRGCIGQHLALIEAKIFLIEFLKKYDFELIKNYKLNMAKEFLFTPREPVKIKLMFRSK